jgi:hypothetical protein
MIEEALALIYLCKGVIISALLVSACIIQRFSTFAM